VAPILLTRSWRQLEDMRGRDIGVVFQDPMASLKPTMRVGDQIMALAVFTAVRLSISSDSHTGR